jgi:hypothetical protein
MKVMLGATILPGQQVVSARNIDGIAYFANAEQDGTTAHYAMWVASRNGFNYSLAVYGDKKFSAEINGEMFSFVRDLKQIDSNRIAHADSKIKTAGLHTDSLQHSPPKQAEPFSPNDSLSRW